MQVAYSGQIGTRSRRPMSCPYGQAMGCLLRVILRQCASLYRDLAVFTYWMATDGVLLFFYRGQMNVTVVDQVWGALQ